MSYLQLFYAVFIGLVMADFLCRTQY